MHRDNRPQDFIILLKSARILSLAQRDVKNPLSISIVLPYNIRVRKILAIASIVAGIVVFIVITFGLASNKPEQLSNAGAMLGTAMFGIVPLVAFVGVGIYLITRKDVNNEKQ
jgi:hypothetical protein